MILAFDRMNSLIYFGSLVLMLNGLYVSTLTFIYLSSTA